MVLPVLGIFRRHSKAFARFKLSIVLDKFVGRYYSANANNTVLSEFSQKYLGSRKVRYTESLNFINSLNDESIPIFRLMDSDGKLLTTAYPIELPDEKLIKAYRDMVTLSVADKILYESQRQGRISFYMTNTGEEAVQVGTAAALADRDLIFAQYRETGVLMHRGFSMQDLMDQCYSNKDDKGKGRQMPVHYGSKALNFVTISSPLGTQLPQAVGAAYAYKRSNPGCIVACYFGEGTASEGDAHAAFNFAATLRCPILFLCRNNGYAISTSTGEQYSGDGVAGRAYSYGMTTVRVDGNDFFAVLVATQQARLLVEQGHPVLIEAMTYRVGHHSTSDDSSAYRTADEVKFWQSSHSNPIDRLKLNLIQGRKIWSDEMDARLKVDSRRLVLEAFSAAEKKKKPSIDLLFTDVYRELTPRLREQMSELRQHLDKYGQHYPLQSYE